MNPIELYTREERKTNGVVYTPDFLAEYLAKKVLHYWGVNINLSSVFDPACGDSRLLCFFAEEVLSKMYIKTLPKIVGIDKDKNAVECSIAKFSDKHLKKFVTKFSNTDGLFPIDGQKSITAWEILRQEIKCDKGFDVALSNPPWGADLSKYAQQVLNYNFTLTKGQFDIYNLFVEVILNNLNENGVYGLILPDSVFSQDQTNLRRLLAKNTTIHLIARLGEKIFSEINRACVVIVGSKSKARTNHHVDCFRLSVNYKKKVLSNELALEEAEKELAHKVPQNRFLKNDNCVFDIDLKIDEQKTFNKIQNTSTFLKDIVMNTRGAEISKKGIVCRCPKCKKWMPYPKTKHPTCSHCNVSLCLEVIETDKIILDHNGVGNNKLKVGEDIYRYTSRSKSWINTLKQGINYKDFNIYQGEKILVRKTGIGITASLDYENSVTNQVVYMLKLKQSSVKKLSLEFVLSILNSRAMTYYLIKKYGENEWKSHPYITQTMLVNLPFPIVNFDSKEHRYLIDKVTKIVKSEVINSCGKNISKPNDLTIERIVAHLFNLNQNDYKAIFKELCSAQQLIPIKRLMNCNYKEIFKINGI